MTLQLWKILVEAGEKQSSMSLHLKYFYGQGINKVDMNFLNLNS